MNLKITNLTDYDLACTNTVYIAPPTLSKLTSTQLITLDSTVFKATPDPNLPENCVALSKIQREFLNKTTGATVAAKEASPPKKAEFLRLSIDLLKNEPISIDTKFFIAQFKKIYTDFPFNESQLFYFFLEKTALKMKVDFLKTENSAESALLADDTHVSVVPANKFVNIENEEGLIREFNYEILGIGGLHKELSQLFRRAFVQRVFSTDTIAKLGVMYVKGIMLYGPPGTGKTLIARQIGKLLDARPPKIVNGPEILSKYVGQSEENIRNLFVDAEEESRARGQQSALHIIIFDEIDAICKSRGSSNTGVGDQIVNQLLSKMDGVESLNNILVVGITNRFDLIDRALLRPGRFEIHIEIGLPDESSRLEILQIHTKKMSKGDFLVDVDLPEIAKISRNYTGAEITAVVKSAVSFALERNIEKKDEKIKVNNQSLRVTMDDFVAALGEVRPSFGGCDFPQLSKIFYETTIFKNAIDFGKNLVEKLVKTNLYNTSSLLIYGSGGTGKTTVASKIAILSKFPFVKILSPRELVGMNEFEKIIKIKEKFGDSYKSKESVIILDNIESLIEYVDIGPRFSNSILQALRTFVRVEDLNKLFVIGTTSRVDIMRDTGIFDDFYAHWELPKIGLDDFNELCTENCGFSEVGFDGMESIKCLLAKLNEPDKGVQ